MINNIYGRTLGFYEYKTQFNNKESLSLSEMKKIDDEENEILREKLKSIDLDPDKYDEEFLNSLIMFPPYDAPGSVKRSWREMEKSASPEIRKEMRSFAFLKLNFFNEQPDFKKNMTNDTNGYLSLISEMKNYSKQYDNPNDLQAQKQYGSYMKLLNLFEKELCKYI